MSRKNRKDEILSYLDADVTRRTAAVDSAKNRLADPTASDADRRTAEATRQIHTAHLVDSKNLARQLRNGDINADDDNFRTWTR